MRARRGQAGVRGGLWAAESSALRKSNAFVPPVGPAPTLHAPAESRSEASKRYRSEACPGGTQVQGSAPPSTPTGANGRRVPAGERAPSEMPDDSFPIAKALGRGRLVKKKHLSKFKKYLFSISQSF